MTLIGFILTLSAAFMWAASNVVVRFAVRAAPGYDPFGFIVWSSLVPVLPFLLLALAMDGSAQVLRQLGGLDLRALLAVLFLAWFATLLAYTLWTRLLQRAPGRPRGAVLAAGAGGRAGRGGCGFRRAAEPGAMASAPARCCRGW